MVVQSNIDYEQWKEEVKDIYSRFGQERADVFLDFIKERYDKEGQVYLPHKLLWRILDIQKKIEKYNQHQVYGSFGRGGYGKSTIMKNVLYAHDPTFNQERIAETMDQFEDVLYKVLKMKDSAFKAIMIDEPSREVHAMAAISRIRDDLIGQIRQNNLIIGVCATELKNIKPALYNLITGMFALRKMFVYDYYDEEKTSGVMGDIWKEYRKTCTYACFNISYIMKRRFIKNMAVCKTTPIDHEQEVYSQKKKQAFLEKLERARAIREMKKKDDLQLTHKDKLILKKVQKGMTQTKIAEHLECTQEYISKRLKILKQFGVTLYKIRNL